MREPPRNNGGMIGGGLKVTAIIISFPVSQSLCCVGEGEQHARKVMESRHQTPPYPGLVPGGVRQLGNHRRPVVTLRMCVTGNAV